jgi:hypothetical protein
LLLLTGGIAWALNLFIVAPLFDPLKNMPGPKASALGTHYSDVTEYVNLFELWRLPLMHVLQS